MVSKTHDGDDRLPTTGPDSGRFDSYRSVTTGDSAIIYDTERDDAWIQATHTVSLADWV
ncbi:DUF7331 family protein [Haloarcula marina]|uniref:DUF7331 family protein n=1 Tax=Haloarcula marina TaxID=2961574 RepID=UPI0020B7239D|nr:hypothetical protein [Halomicroarcula marina]